MATLNQLTKTYLIKLAEEWNIALKMSMSKNDQIKKIRSAKIPEKKLGQLIKKYYDKYQENIRNFMNPKIFFHKLVK